MPLGTTYVCAAPENANAIAAPVDVGKALDATDVPTELVAVAVKVYVSPVVSPVNVHERDPVVVHVSPPLAEVAISVALMVYSVIGDPPSDAGAVQVTVAEVTLATTALVMIGAPGADAGVTEFDVDDGGDVPIALVAVTVNV